MTRHHDPDDDGKPFPTPVARERLAYNVEVRKVRPGGDSFRVTGEKRLSKQEYFKCSSDMSGTGTVVVVTDDPRSIYDKFGIDTVVSVSLLGPGMSLPDDLP